MTTVGHSLTGLTIAVLFAPCITKISKKIGYYLLFVFCALIPDIEVHGWGHHKYHISHSIPLMGALVTLFFMISVVIPALRKKAVYWRFFIACSLAWLSHFILDATYNHGKGIMVMWPISKGRLVLTLPWFSTIPPFPFTMVHFKIYMTEFLFYFPILLIAIFLKKRMRKTSLSHINH